jgi:ABC-type Fe3+-hydroxamate transport system substrate-binding protein
MFIPNKKPSISSPKRIISLVPSISSLLNYLELDIETIGITKFCTHPKHWLASKTIIGGTKNIHFKKVMELNPDLIIANKEENIKEQVEDLAEYFPVWLTDVNNLNDALNMIADIGQLTNRIDLSQQLIEKINIGFNSFQNQKKANYRTCYLIWKEPYMSIGGDTFIHDMMLKAGLDNIFGHLTRYPTITIDEIISNKPDLLLLSSEPYPFKNQHINELRNVLPNTKICLVDGIPFSWYGDMIQHSPLYFKELHEIAITNLPKATGPDSYG